MSAKRGSDADASDAIVDSEAGVPGGVSGAALAGLDGLLSQRRTSRFKMPAQAQVMGERSVQATSSCGRALRMGAHAQGYLAPVK